MPPILYHYLLVLFRPLPLNINTTVNIVFIVCSPQGGIVIVDSPGIGESREITQTVKEFLPTAFAFIYVINSSNAGGLQPDRVC